MLVYEDVGCDLGCDSVLKIKVASSSKKLVTTYKAVVNHK